MRRIFPSLAAALALSLSAPGLSAVRESVAPAEQYLVEMRANAPGGGRFLSFLPNDRAARVWSAERIGPWKKRVAETMRLPGGAALQVADIQPHPFGEPFGAMPVRGELLRFLGKGLTGMEILPLADGSAATNRFAVEGIPEGRVEARLRWVRDGKGASFALRTWQGAAQQIWFVDWETLLQRWNARLRDRNPAGVLSEMDAIRDSGRLSAEGGAIWRERLDGFLRTHPDLWPKIVFTNILDDTVIVSCGGASKKLPSGGIWAKKVVEEPPEGEGIPWSFVIDGSGEEPEEFSFDPVPWRIDDKYGKVQLIQATARVSKGAPRLSVGNSLIPSDELLSRLARDQPNIAVRYADGGNDVPLGIKTENGKKYVEVDPRRRILAFSVDAPFCKRAELRPKKEYYRNGENIELNGSVPLLPWPDIELRNPRSDRIVTNTLTWRLPDGSPPLGGNVTSIIPPGETRIVKTPSEIGAGRIALEVGIVSSAAFASEKASTVMGDKFLRGATRIEIAVEPNCDTLPEPPKPREKPKMPEEKARKRIASKVSGILDDINQYVTSLPGRRDTMRNQLVALPSDRKETIRIVRAHLSECPDGCGDCGSFRRHLAAIGATGPNPTDKQILLAGFREYLMGKGRTEAAADDGVAELLPLLETLPDDWAGGK